MARQKKTSKVIEKAEIRADSLKSIDSALTLTGELTLAAYEAKIAEVKQALSVYNTQLSELDGYLNAFQAKERELRELSTRMLAAVRIIYGRDSSEYEQAGGTRTSEYAR